MAGRYFDALERQARNDPAATFFELRSDEGDPTELSYQHMLDGIGAAAALLREQGVGPGEVVLIFAQHSVGMLLAFFGAQWLGAIPAFMPPPTVKQDGKAWLASHSALVARIEPACIVSEPGCLEQVVLLRDAPVLSTAVIEHAPAGVDCRRQAMPDDAPAFLQHSSGTTGLKKGVIVTYRQLLAQIDAYTDAIGLVAAHDRIVSWLPLYHDMGLIAATLAPFALGVPVRIIATFSWLANPTSIIDLMVATPNSFVWLPNFAFAYLAQRGRIPAAPDALANVKAVINCSEPCKEQAMDAFYDRFSPAGLSRSSVRVCYAMAEYVFAVTQTASGKPPVLAVDRTALETRREVLLASYDNAQTQRIASVGKPINGAQVRIDAAQGEAVGEICIAGPSLCAGYYRNVELSARKFRGGWYHSGDLGFLWEGELYVTGRADDLIIVRGRNIYAHDIEDILTHLPGVKAGRAVAFGIDNAKAGTQDLVVMAETAADAVPADIERHAREAILATFGVSPTAIRLVGLNRLVKTSSGKISRSENRAHFLARTLD
jgi:fatty-acyl-CoA synthase